MRKRKVSRSEGSKTLVKSASQLEQEEEALQLQQHRHHQIEEEGSEGQGFFACYLLASLNPHSKGHTYIGFTVNPLRRIRQHNGEIRKGAWRTKNKRPWEMVLCIYGFPTNVSALQFEWAWQHPLESLAVRKAAAGFKSLIGIANKIKLAYTMLTLPRWQSMNITVNFFSTMYMKHYAGCPSLPENMKVQIGSMNELPCYTERIMIGRQLAGIRTSSKSLNYGSKINESCRRSQESEAREPLGHLLARQDWCQPFGSIASPMSQPSPATSKKEINEDTDFVIVMNKSSTELGQPECVQSCAKSATGKFGEMGDMFIVPLEAEIIDLSTRSPCCGSVSDSKRAVSSCDLIDLTKSPNFVQL